MATCQSLRCPQGQKKCVYACHTGRPYIPVKEMPSDYSRMGKMVAKKELDRSATGWVVTSVAASFPFAASESSDLWSIWDLWAHVNPPREVVGRLREKGD
nr:hypothetical protein L204_06344 [Cryptococcus depauperatus CBS 7855]